MSELTAAESKKITQDAMEYTENCIRNRNAKGSVENLLMGELEAVRTHAHACNVIAQAGYVSRTSHHAYMADYHMFYIRDIIAGSTNQEYKNILSDARTLSKFAHHECTMAFKQTLGKESSAMPGNLLAMNEHELEDRCDG